MHTLTEDYCLGKGLSYPEEKTKLLQQGFTLIHEDFHPAIGRVSVYKVLVCSPVPPPPALFVATS